MGNYYSYKRISTDTERQNFNRQIKSLERYAKDHDIEYLIDFTEEKSAKNFTDRPQLKNWINYCRPETQLCSRICIVLPGKQKMAIRNTWNGSTEVSTWYFLIIQR